MESPIDIGCVLSDPIVIGGMAVGIFMPVIDGVAFLKCVDFARREGRRGEAADGLAGIFIPLIPGGICIADGLDGTGFRVCLAFFPEELFFFGGGVLLEALERLSCAGGKACWPGADDGNERNGATTTAKVTIARCDI